MLPQIDFTTYPSQIFWALVSFGILYFMISKIIMPKFETIILSRQDQIKSDIVTSDNIFKQVTSLKKDYEDKLKNTYTEATTIKKNKLAEFSKLSLKTKTEFKQEIDNIIFRNLSNLDNNLEEFKSSQSDAVLNLSSFMLEKITMTKVDMEILKNIIKRF